MTTEISFVIGQCYFLVGYHDRNFKLLFIDTYIFIGHGDDGGSSSDYWYFQSAQSFAERGQMNPHDEADEGHIILMRKDNLDGITDWSGLMAELTATQEKWQ